MWQEMEHNGRKIEVDFSSGKPVMRVPKEGLEQTVDEMQISQEVKDYLHKIGIKNGEDYVDRQHELPSNYSYIVRKWLVFGEPTE